MNITKLANQAKSMLASKSYHSGAMSAIEQAKENQRVTRFVLTSALVCLVAIEPSIAAATTTTSTSAFGNIDSVATKILSFVTGTFGKTVATIAVVVLGMMAMFGKLAWDHAIKVIFGIAIVFGAASVIDALSGGMTTTVAK
jgi:type IV secretion system protein VirB2